METILVVDDGEVNRELLRTLLEGEYRVLEAADGEAALRLATEHSIDLVLLDVRMPGMDGLDVTRKLRELRGDELLPILLLTSLSEKGERLRGFEAGADDFLSKPVDVHELRMRVRAFLRARRLYREREALLAEAQQLHLMKDDFVALLVHDLRNPLGALSAWLELLRIQGVTPDARDALDGASSAALRVRELVDDLLQARLLEDGAVQATLAAEPIQTVARAAAETTRGLATESGIVLRLEFPDDPLVVAHDRALVQRALENVLTNAIRYTPRGAGVTFRVAREREDVLLEIADEGPGIPEEERPLLFSKYGSSSLRQPGARRGHGLGLFFVGLVMEAHHGVVRAFNGEHRGTRVVLSLPLEPSEAIA